MEETVTRENVITSAHGPCWTEILHYFHVDGAHIVTQSIFPSLLANLAVPWRVQLQCYDKEGNKLRQLDRFRESANSVLHQGG